MKYRLTIAALSLGLAAAVTGAVAGGSHPVVVELYTSQGCSSCPPADALLAKLVNHGRQNGVIAMSLPITYWDMLGWKDTLASDGNTLRQKAYAAAMGHGGVYTPQIIVDGVKDVVGSREDKVEAAIDAALEARDGADEMLDSAHYELMDVDSTNRAGAAKALVLRREKAAALLARTAWTVDVGLSQSQKNLRVAVAAAPRMLRDSKLDATIWMFNLRSSATVHIEAGENSGRMATYRNVVVGPIKEIGKWHGENVALDVSQQSDPPHDGVVILVQQGGYGRMLGAAYLGHVDYYASQ
jgi:hypothetical protein